MDRADDAHTAAGPSAQHLRGRSSRDRRRDPCPVQHLSRRRRRPAAIVRPAATAVAGASRFMTLDELNGLGAEAAARELLRCCGSTRWAREMAAARPFASIESMTAAADSIWSSLDQSDRFEAFAAHPKIGAGADAEWSAAEQAGTASAPADVLARLAEANREYEARFGFIFIVCATGKGAEEMLDLLQR